MDTLWQPRPQWHPRSADAALALSLFAFSVGGSVVSSQVFGESIAVWPAVLLSAISCAALFWRRTHPRTVVALAVLCAVGESWLGFFLTPLLQASLMAALYSLGLRTDRRNTRTCAFLTLAALIATALIAGPFSHNLLLTTVNPVAWVFLPAVLGSAVQLRRDYLSAVHARAEHAERTREEEARHRVAQERMRIARELHDVVAHHLALANAQAGTAAHLSRTHPDQARDMLDNLAETTASALRELKATVGLLRQDNDSDSPLDPSPGLALLKDLTAAFGSAGLDVSVTYEGEPRSLSAGLDLTAFRIVQEALTNVAKHASTKAAYVRLAYSADLLTVTITNEDAASSDMSPSGMSPSAVSAPGQGFGLIGMRERAHSVGGALHAGPRPEGGFEVTCTLPLPRRQREESHAT
ncbi:sensor histidine kinase [Streptomyces sp. NPDC088116]|uniref:sensor histidine kinase n=1 Tax=Streptomyces sp. NPDC088116 TaxID=3365825 RepID=UPI0037FC6B5E